MTTASKTRRRRCVLPGMPLTTIVTRLEAMDQVFHKLPPRCFLGVSLASSPFTASPEHDVTVFVIDNTMLPACTRICWGGVPVVEAPIADTSLADVLFCPSPLSGGICTTGAVCWRGGKAEIPLFLAISITLAMVRGCVFVMGGWISVESTLSTVQQRWNKTHKSFAKCQEKSTFFDQKEFKSKMVGTLLKQCILR
jgi:hypothetical protein